MRRSVLILGAVIGLILLALWAMGGFAAVEVWITETKRLVQESLAQAVRAIKQGRPGALFGLLTLCFSYGVLHAAGPGHGKVLIGGYGMGRRVPIWSLAGISLAASLAQAAVAVIFVYAVVALLGWNRDAARGVAEEVMAPIGTVAIGCVGLWLMVRGLRKLWALRGVGHAHDGHDHHGHDDGADCGCGHAHGPSLDQVEQASGWRDRLALVAGIALRPCSGALFLLILTWQLGIAAAGVAGTFAMGLGTATVTIGVAALAVWAREGALASLPFAAAARILPWFEAVAGGVIAVIAFGLLGKVL